MIHDEMYQLLVALSIQMLFLLYAASWGWLAGSEGRLLKTPALGVGRLLGLGAIVLATWIWILSSLTQSSSEDVIRDSQFIGGVILFGWILGQILGWGCYGFKKLTRPRGSLLVTLREPN